MASTSTSGGVFATEPALRLFDFDATPERALSRSPLAHLETLVAALASLGCEAVVPTGRPPVPEPSARNVHLVESLPQALLLHSADLLVSHGGYNSVREAVRAGVPMAVLPVLPVLHDQMHNAHRATGSRSGCGCRTSNRMRWPWRACGRWRIR